MSLGAGGEGPSVPAPCPGFLDALKFPSSAQQFAVAQAWPLLYSINQTDQMLAHLQSFSSVPEHFTLPDSTKSGVPLFYIPPGSTTPVSGPELGTPFMPSSQEAGTTALPSLLSLRHPNQR